MKTAAATQAETKPHWPYYPFLFSLYPVLYLYKRNIHEVQSVQVLWAAMISLGVAAGYWFLTRAFSKQLGKRSLALFLFLLLFHFYGLYYDQIYGLLPNTSRPLQAHGLAFILPGTIWLGLTALVFKSKRKVAILNRLLQTAVFLLLAWNIGGIAVHQAGSFLDLARARRSENQHLPVLPNGTPDIYCFVLDEFAAPESARRLFGYDNGAFVASLRQQGFFVAEQSRSRFTQTEPAIAAILNLGEFSNRDDPFPLIGRNAVAAWLKNRGYRVIEFASLHSIFMKAADQRFYYPLVHASIFFDDFYRALFERSLLRVLPDLWQLKKIDLSHYYRERIAQVFSELPAVVKTPGPKFVFVHLFSPHEPFVFDPNGDPVDPEHIWDHNDPRYYLGQYIYISRRILDTAAMILANSPTAPVIIMQSDHGYRGSLRKGKKSKTVDRSEMIRVFNALHLPGIPLPAIDPALSPLNNFRLIFNLYFGTHYPLLKNP
ncbi:MAG: hypothetical protein NTW95_09430 [Candidatus Aminicenantes bacterium]|nr:hypothetical protein [Candidatus Aminicenantes bacterium]